MQPASVKELLEQRETVNGDTCVTAEATVEARQWHTLSGEQDLLSIARQPQPGWSLGVRQHLYPVHELLAAATNSDHGQPNNNEHIC